MRGIFITFEGVEGCGKTTQIQLLADYLRGLGRAVVQTREPGGTPAAERVRGLLLDPEMRGMAPMTELLLYAAARAQHVAEIIRPALSAGAVVLCDRYADSTTAYQGGGRALSMDDIRTLHSLATGGVWPDCTILLDLPAEEGLARTHGRGAPDRIEGEPLDFHHRVRDAFLRIAAEEPERITIINAAGPAETVAEAVRERVDRLLQDN